MSKSEKKVACTMEGVAKNFAYELDAQFRTLNNFVSHGGEIGRAHEYYLRGVLARFLPDNLQLGSGFIASPKWTSRQQDILIYKDGFTPLFKVGDCVVIDYNALVGTVEVKTNINSSSNLVKALERISEVEGVYRNHGLRALYAWDGLRLNTALKALWQFVRKDPTNLSSQLPHLIYVRGKYLLIKNDDDKTSPPFFLWEICEKGLTEGQALLGLVHAVWQFGGLHQSLFPWWLLSWHNYYGHIPAKAEQIQWPSDLEQIIMNS